jgi:hypothetical protein
MPEMPPDMSEMHEQTSEKIDFKTKTQPNQLESTCKFAQGFIRE